MWNQTLEEKYNKKLWLLLTNSIGQMSRNPDLYSSLNELFSDQMLAYKRLIRMDIDRTDRNLSIEYKEKMQRILYSFAKRNMEIGYCQGMNFVCHFLLEMGFKEEEVFWIICYITEIILPRSYYVNVTPVIANVEIFKIMLGETNPKLFKHLQLLGADLNFALVSNFITLFTTLKNQKVFLLAEN